MPRKPKSVDDRPRGGASLPCPQCGGRSYAKDTRLATRNPKPKVQRIRYCKACELDFFSKEVHDHKHPIRYWTEAAA